MGQKLIASVFYGRMFSKAFRMWIVPSPLPCSWSMIFVGIPIIRGIFVSVSTATSTVNLATFTPLQDGTSSSIAFLAIPTLQTSPPSTCIDACFNNATGSGKQGGCVGISGQYECICTFPAMMQSFETCMSASCALENSTIQETLGNVQQICASCTPDGCNTFSISASGNSGDTITFQDPFSTPSASLCYSTTQSAGTSSLGVGGFASVGPISCGATSVSGSAGATPLASGFTGIALSDAASPSGPSSTTSGASSRKPFCVWGAAFFAMSLGAALV